MIKSSIKYCLFSGLNASSNAKCVLLSNQKCKIKPTLINSHPNEFTQGYLFYQLAVNLVRCARRLNTLNDLPNQVCVPNKTEDLNLSVFNMITGTN